MIHRYTQTWPIITQNNFVCEMLDERALTYVLPFATRLCKNKDDCPVKLLALRLFNSTTQARTSKLILQTSRCRSF